MRAILFDIDGTLVLTGEADGPCFGKAYRAVFNEAPRSTSWDDYAHVTDWGILDEALGAARGQSSTLAERTAFEREYCEAWRQRNSLSPGSCIEVPGAATLVQAITANDQIVCGVATGGTRLAAQHKLQTVGIDTTLLPGAFSNDAITRASIVRNGVQALGVAPADVVYLGDGRWDVLTCRTLGIAFIGIAAESSPEMLHAAGAQTVLPDFKDQDAFWNAVNQAKPPTEGC
jgi:phosphoglycolate phosphatase-like HAD superfamily hydrolase